MSVRIHHIGMSMAIIAMLVCVRYAAAASATATVTATITETAPVASGLALTPPQLDMHGKSDGQLTIANRSEQWRAVNVDLATTSGSSDRCKLRYSPRYSELPPGGYQVLRLQFRADPSRPCRTNYNLVINVREKHGFSEITVPVYTASE